MIAVRDLCVRVPGFALAGATFSVPAGGVGVVSGPTGAGKTTLLETIAGVRAASAGTVMLDGRDVSALPPEARRIGLVYQAGWLFPHLDVRGNVCYGATDDTLVQPLLELLHLAPLLAKPVAMLSGGERQLVALARALARAPRTLLLDEPFAAMDGALRATVRPAVLQWAAARGMTTMLVTHDVQEAALAGSVQLRVTDGVVTVVP